VDVGEREQVRAALATFRSTLPEDFAALFKERRVVADVPDDIAALPVVEAASDGFRSRCMMFSWEGDFFACDWRGATADEVFRPHHDEVAVCAPQYLPQDGCASVLDVGTGCGIYGIRARDRTGAAVTARDVNPRAVAFARRNAVWNGAPGITYEVADLFDGLAPSFDLVILGLPYQPAPAPGDAKTYSYAGDDGSLLMRAALSRLDTVLADEGTAVACCASLGTSSGAAIVDELPRLLARGAWRVSMSTLPAALSVRDWWQQKFARAMTEQERAWLERLEASGRGWFHYCILRVTLLSRRGSHRVDVESLGLRGEMTTARLLSRLP
jgi:methylase of polypeptide subunit release factors